MWLPEPGVVGGVVVGDDPAVGGDVAVGPLHEAVRSPRLRLGRRRVGIAVAVVVEKLVLGCVTMNTATCIKSRAT